MIAPQRNEAWHKVMEAVTLDGEKFSSAFKIAHAVKGDSPRPGSIGCEVRVEITGGGTDDTDLRVYACPDADAALRSTLPEDERLLRTGANDPLRSSFWVDWQTVVSGAQISLRPTGVTANMVATIWIRRFWMGNPART